MGADGRTRLCPQAYEHTDTRNFTQPPGTKLVGIGIALVGLLIVWFLTYFALFHVTSGDVGANLKTLKERAGANPKAPVPPTSVKTSTQGG
jgi:hypothetical protein